MASRMTHFSTLLNTVPVMSPAWAVLWGKGQRKAHHHGKQIRGQVLNVEFSSQARMILLIGEKSQPGPAAFVADPRSRLLLPGFGGQFVGLDDVLV
jgi:hypothetical protein